MPSERKIVEAQGEMGRLGDAIRDLRAAQMRTADPRQAERLGQALKTMRERAELANLTLDKFKDQREQLDAVGKALIDFRDATLAGKAAMLAGGVAAAGRLPGAAIAGLAGAASGAVSAISGLAQAVGRFVEASNPAEMMRFQIAMRDLSAAVGRVFEPVILVLTEFANVVNSFITSLQPVIGPIVAQLAAAWGMLARAVLDAVAPIVESLVPVFGLLADVVLPPLVAVFRALSDAIRNVINWIRSWLGMEPLGHASERGGTRTVAAQQARQIGIQDIGAQARASAFSSSAGANSMIDLQRANNQLTARTNELLERAGQGILERAGRAIGTAAAQAVGAIDGFFSGR